MRSSRSRQARFVKNNNSKLAWRLRLAEKESELLPKAYSYRQVGLNDLLTSSLQGNNPSPSKVKSNEKSAVKSNNETINAKLDKESLTELNASPLPQNLAIVTYRGLNEQEAAKLNSYQLRQQIADSASSKEATSTSKSEVELVKQFKSESMKTLAFSKLLAKNIIANSKAKLAKTVATTEKQTAKQQLKKLLKTKLQTLSSSLVNWQSIWQKSPDNADAFNAKLAKLKWYKRLCKRHFSLQTASTFLVSLLFILSFFYCFYSWQFNNKQANKHFAKVLLQSKGLQLAGQVETTNVNLKQINLQLSYPVFADEYLNNKLKERVDSLMQPYIKAAKNLKAASQSRFKPLVVINYDATVLAKCLLSVVFTLNYYENGSKQQNLSDWQYSSLYYDLANHQLLNASDLFPNWQSNLQELADNFSTLYRYENKQNLGLSTSKEALKNLLFTPDKIVLILDPRHCKANLMRTDVASKQLIAKGGSRELFKNYFGLNYAEAGKFFNQASEQKLALNYDAWQKYYDNPDKDKLLPYSTKENASNLSLPYKFLALTINSLPNASDLKQLITLLRANQAHATFFISLEEAKHAENKPLINEILEAGHEIAALITANDLANNVESKLAALTFELANKIGQICGTDIKYLRLENTNSIDDLDILRYPIIASNNPIERSDYISENISKLLEHNPEAGDIISLNSKQAKSYLEALKESLPFLKEQQVRYVNVTECAALYKKKLQAANIYDSLN